jgi:nicotinamidase-related amidase
MTNPQLLRRDDTVLLVIDIQEAFRTRIADWGRVVGRAGALIDGCRLLGIPVIITEQYPKGLGETVPEIAQRAPDAEKLAKLEFSSACAPGFDDLLRRLGRQQVLICGIEAHVCVHQTVVDLARRGNNVHLAVDACSSQSATNRQIGIRRALADGANETSVEMALFELLRTAQAAEFKAVQRLVKELS